MLAHGDATRNLPENPSDFLEISYLLIVGGNDTTRNSMSGGVWALNNHPDEYRKLRDNPSLIPSAVSEIIRWQSPIVHMRRTAVADGEIGGKQIREGDKVVMRYISGNRDEDCHRSPERVPGRSHPPPAAFVVRFRHSPLRRQSARRATAMHPMGRNVEARDCRGDPAGANPHLLQLHPRHLALPVRIAG